MHLYPTSHHLDVTRRALFWEGTGVRCTCTDTTPDSELLSFSAIQPRPPSGVAHFMGKLRRIVAWPTVTKTQYSPGVPDTGRLDTICTVQDAVMQHALTFFEKVRATRPALLVNTNLRAHHGQQPENPDKPPSKACRVDPKRETHPKEPQRL